MDSTKMVVGNSGAGNTTFWSVATLKQFGNTATTYDSIYVSPGNTDVLQLYINSDTGIPTTLWNINTGTQIGAETYPWAYSPIYLPDGALVAYGTKGVTIWDLKDNSLRATLQGHSSPVTHLLFSSDGKMLASLAGDGIVLTTDLETHASFHLGDEKYSGQFTDQMAFDESGSQFRAVGSDGTIFVWGVATNPPALLDTKNAPYKDTATPSRFAISPNGKYLVYELANGADDALRIWDIDHEKDYAEAIPIENCCGGAIAFSPDSRTMFYNDGETINQWDFDRKTVVARVPVEQQNSLSNLNLIMGPDAPRFLLSKFADAYGNYQSQIWDWTKHSKVGSPMSGDLRILGFNNSEGTVFYLDSFGKLIRWKWNQNSAGWRDLLCPLARRNLTQEEWQLYFRGETYPSQLACPEYPPGK
jgi:WD40 repeat protein